ncbi:MAG: hypothetical protein AB7G21_09120 [Dehalococcoidia bacterium]
MSWGKPGRKPVHTLGVKVELLEDPGDAGVIASVTWNTVRLRCGAGAESRVLGPPNFIGQELTLVLEETAGGAITVTCGQAFDQNSHTQAVLAAGGDSVRLIGAGQVDPDLGVLSGGVPAWRLLVVDGATLGP